MTKVQQVNDLYEKAMDMAEEVYLAQRKKDTETAKKWAAQSFEIEKKAAMLLVDDVNTEPTRSVLFKGAACLAINAGLYREAEQMIGHALSGNPPIEIVEELRNLLLEIAERKPGTKTDKSLKGQLLSGQISRLPKEVQQTVSDFIDFLIQQHSRRA